MFKRLAVVTALVATSQLAAVTATTAAELHFVTQCRALDTRVPTTGIGGPNTGARVAADTEYKALLRAPWTNAEQQGGTSGCAVPTQAQAVILNVVATGSIAPGYLEIYPWDDRPPVPTSLLNYSTAQTIANQITIPLHPLPLNFPGIDSWDLVFRPQAAGVHIIADVVGYTEDTYPSFPFGIMEGVIVDKFQDHGTTHLVVEPPGGDCTPFNHDTCFQVECAPYALANEVCLVVAIGECVEIEGFHRPNAGDDHWVGRLVRAVTCP